ncbi:MAG: acyl carrier protein [Oscillospiraceae bacterium]|nr:acyl carrier protein [Oscillospiraceae bacterium]
MYSVAEKIKAMLAEQLDIGAETVAEESDIGELGADSLDIVELVMSIEEQFGVAIEEDDVSGFRTVGDVVSFIEENT